MARCALLGTHCTGACFLGHDLVLSCAAGCKRPMHRRAGVHERGRAITRGNAGAGRAQSRQQQVCRQRFARCAASSHLSQPHPVRFFSKKMTFFQRRAPSFGPTPHRSHSSCAPPSGLRSGCCALWADRTGDARSMPRQWRRRQAQRKRV